MAGEISGRISLGFFGALERGDAGERVVERAAKRVHVGAEVNLLLADLLRRDVVGSTPDLIGVLLHAGEAEVH